MTDGENRRKQILEILNQTETPISGTQLAKRLSVSRQVIVQDIALLRAIEKNIIATTKGYMLFHKQTEKYYRCFFVNHGTKEIEDELLIITQNGGKILDVIIDHDVYGQISVDLGIENVKDVKDFCDKIHNSKAKPLNILADGKHMHTVEASSEVILNNIEQALLKKGYLC